MKQPLLAANPGPIHGTAHGHGPVLHPASHHHHRSGSDSCLLNDTRRPKGMMPPFAGASPSWHPVWGKDMHFDPRAEAQALKGAAH